MPKPLTADEWKKARAEAERRLKKAETKRERLRNARNRAVKEALAPFAKERDAIEERIRKTTEAARAPFEKDAEETDREVGILRATIEEARKAERRARLRMETKTAARLAEKYARA